MLSNITILATILARLVCETVDISRCLHVDGNLMRQPSVVRVPFGVPDAVGIAI